MLNSPSPHVLCSLKSEKNIRKICISFINGVFKYLDDEFAEDRYVKKLPKAEGIKLRKCNINKGSYINIHRLLDILCVLVEVLPESAIGVTK